MALILSTIDPLGVSYLIQMPGVFLVNSGKLRNENRATTS